MIGAGTLQPELQSLADGFDGRIGICVHDGASTVCVNGDQRFSMQSVVKLVVAAATMDSIDRRSWRIDDPITIRKEDLSLYVQPLAKEVEVKGGQVQTTVGDLVVRAVTQSDSAASDVLFARLEGAIGIRAFLARHGIEGIRVDRDERHLQTDILGLNWRPEYVEATVLAQARKMLSERVRDAAFDAYVKDERDTATPKGMVSFLYALASGNLLSPESNKFLLEVMRRTTTFPDRLEAGTPPGWHLGHKTGTSPTWKGMTVATNDVGILTAPDGGSVALAAFIAESRRDEKERAALFATAARATAAAFR